MTSGLPPSLLAGPSAASREAEPPRFTSEIREFVENFKPGGHDLAGQIALLSPEESLKRFRPHEGFAVELAASEPVVRQPLDMHFDRRGRLWVMQYLQYPFPAGLTVVEYDQHLRAVYDRAPRPPPHDTPGADKLTILEDTDGDGVYDRHIDFLTGLNLATSFVLDRDGVWVMHSPYLLFYPDRNGDDVPDGDPEVHLSGFGIEDTHTLANSLDWGPDGWLYGATGSETTLNVQGVQLLGSGIWRYHPGTRIFEVFAEGGGNTFSLEFDRYGRSFSGSNDGATRGMHYIQGGAYRKVFTKVGPPMNPFSFGYLEHMDHEGYKQRFPQTFIRYDGGLFKSLQGQIVVGMALTNRVQASEVFADGSTFRTVDRTVLATSADKAFRPVDIEAGPDGCIYIADWYDARLSHLSPRDTWDKSSGRIYRIVPQSFSRPVSFDLRRRTTPELLQSLSHENRWFREQARRMLATRPDDLAPALKAAIGRNGEDALEAFWVLNLRGELDAAYALKSLRHPNEHIRRWTVRLLGDRNSVDAQVREELVALARSEPAAEVRSQLASTARRLPAGQALPIIRELLAHEKDAGDKHIPLLLWWAIESKADSSRKELITMLSDPKIWRSTIFSQHIAERLAMRYAADQGPKKKFTHKNGTFSEWRIQRDPQYFRRNLEMCARLMATAPDEAGMDLLVQGMAEGLAGRLRLPEFYRYRWYDADAEQNIAAKPLPPNLVPRRLQETVNRLWANRTRNAPLVALAGHLGHAEAIPAAVALINSRNLTEADQQRLIDLFASTGDPAALPSLASLLRQERDQGKRQRLLAALNGFDGPAAAEMVMDVFPDLSLRLRIVAQRMLSAKPGWVLQMLQRMADGKFDPGVLSASNIAAIRRHKDSRITALLERHLRTKHDDPAELMAQRLFEQGKTAYSLNCAACHQENGRGQAGLAPSLVASPWVQQGAAALVRIVLHGKNNPGRGFLMPPLVHLDDEQIASVLTYVRREFGNQPGMVTPSEAGSIRAATSARAETWTDVELATELELTTMLEQLKDAKPNKL